MAPFDEMLRIAPHRRWRIPGSTSWASSNGARTCTSNIIRKCFSLNVSTGPNHVTAPLLTRTSTGPSWRSVSSTRRARSSGRARLAATATASPSASRIDWTVSWIVPSNALWPASVVRADTATRGALDGEAPGDLGADPAAGAGHDGHPSVQ